LSGEKMIGMIVFALCFLSFAWMNEFEHLGNKNKKMPRVREVLKLGHSRSQRWFYGYLFLGLIFAVVVISNIGKKITPLPWSGVVLIICSQVFFWILLIRRIKSKISE
jgi:Mn2+/Fe2+ NRAMP family transporter